jgi:hypothetical protein
MGFWSLEATASRIMNEMESVFDDPRLNYKLVKDKVLVSRAAVLTKYLSNYPGEIPGQYYNECCIPITCEPICEGAPISINRAKLPSTPGMLGKRAYVFVGTVDGKVSFDHRNSVVNDYEDYTPIGTYDASKDPYYVLVGNTADLYNLPTPNMKTLLVRGVFSDPLSCKCPEDRIFVPEDHIDEIEQFIKKDLASFLIQRRIDKMNNANTDN